VSETVSSLAPLLSTVGVALLVGSGLVLAIRRPHRLAPNPLDSPTVSTSDRAAVRIALTRVELTDDPRVRDIALARARYFASSGPWILACMPVSALGWVLLPSVLYLAPALVGWVIACQVLILCFGSGIYASSVRRYQNSCALLRAGDGSADGRATRNESQA
jgi:hypothetical protein